MTKPNHPEIGRELLAADLRRGMIVWLQKGPTLVTLWVMEAASRWVRFYAGETRTIFDARVLPNGRITDDAGSELTVYLYMGKP